MKLQYNKKTERYMLDGINLHCGDKLLAYQEEGFICNSGWIKTTIEMQQGFSNPYWYLQGFDEDIEEIEVRRV